MKKEVTIQFDNAKASEPQKAILDGDFSGGSEDKFVHYEAEVTYGGNFIISDKFIPYVDFTKTILIKNTNTGRSMNLTVFNVIGEDGQPSEKIKLYEMHDDFFEIFRLSDKIRYMSLLPNHETIEMQFTNSFANPGDIVEIEYYSTKIPQTCIFVN